MLSSRPPQILRLETVTARCASPDDGVPWHRVPACEYLDELEVGPRAAAPTCPSAATVAWVGGLCLILLAAGVTLG